MIKGLYYSGRSMESKFKSIEVIANNLANVNSTGFKKTVSFNEIISEQNKSQIKQATDLRQGTLVFTGSKLDLGISGEGFFAVETQNGLMLSRNGNFRISDDGFLTTDSGQRVLGENGPINFSSVLLEDNSAITISKSGLIKAGDIEIDRLLVLSALSPDMLMKGEGASMMISENQIIPANVNDFQIIQGYLEESNVNPIEEMTAMIKVHQEYDSVSKMINFMDRSLEKAIEIGKL